MANYSSIFKIGSQYGEVANNQLQLLSPQDVQERQLAVNEMDYIDPSSVTFANGKIAGPNQNLSGIGINQATANAFGFNATGLSPGNTMYSNVWALDQARGKASEEDFFSANPGWTPGNPYTPVGPPQNAPTAQATNQQSPFQQAFGQYKSQGVQPQNPAEARALTSQVSTTQQPQLNALGFLQGDEFMSGLIQTFQDFINPVNQKASLAQTYQQMIKDSGIQALDMELLNAKNVIEGTEEDIKNEVMKAGGMITESQLSVLTNARNKQLIKNYNTLLETRNAKEKYLSTLIDLEAQDRAAADRRFEQSFNMAMQIADYGQKMKANAVESLDRTRQTIGWAGIMQATQGDEYTQNLIEKTYGLPKGGLALAVQQEAQQRAQAEEERQLGLQERKLSMQLKSEQIKTEQAQRAKIYADTQKIINANKGTVLDPNTIEGRKQLALQKGQIDQVGNILGSGSLRTAVGPNVFSRYGGLRNFFRPGAANFIGDVEQLRSQLNLESLISAKERGATFGALSDQELQVLSTAGTKLGSWLVKDKKGNVTGYKVRESDFKRELDKINNFAKLDYIYRGGNPIDVSVQLMEDGTYWTQNSDGSFTQL